MPELINVDEESLLQYNMTTNITSHGVTRICANHAPRSYELLSNLGLSHIILVLCMLGLTLATLAIYIEEVLFCVKAFRISERRKKTIWILAFFPVFSVCAFIGILVPKSGPLVHMFANLFFCTCLYQILRLAVSYMGGTSNIWRIINSERQMKLNTLPICCCCVCCPSPPFTRRNFLKITLLVLQITIVRPICLFISAVLWTDSFRAERHQQVFSTGEFSPRRSFLWLATINVISTCMAVWGLVMTSKALEPELEKDFVIRGKIMSIQGTLIMTVIPNIIIGGLVGGGVIQCSELLPAKVRGEEIYFCVLVIIMLPFSLLGRKNFRRISDGNCYAAGSTVDDSPQPMMNGEENVKQAVIGQDYLVQSNAELKEKEASANNNRKSVRIDLSDGQAVEYLMKENDCPV